MPLLLGLDLGTTTITAVALDADSASLVACASQPNRAQLPAAPGRSEWNPTALLDTALLCLRDLAAQCTSRHDLAGLGITGQQHGTLLVDRSLRPLGPFINWQDRRTEERPADSHPSTLDLARNLLGDVRERTGCRLAAGYLGATLYWLARHESLPSGATACFLMDYATAALTGTPPTTDPTCAASSGLFDLLRNDWADDLIQTLHLPRDLFPPVRPSGTFAGSLTSAMAEVTGLPAGLPIFGGIGDNQASFLGSVARPTDTLLLNVGTGGQVAAWASSPIIDPTLETRPFPLDGYLLVSAGLVGGAAYAHLERFFRAVLRDLAALHDPGDVYSLMNRLAASVPSGSDGLLCDPFFSGTRLEPTRRAAWTGISADNLSPGHFARALLEGMARTFAASADRLCDRLGHRPALLVGAGNGIRANPLLAAILADQFAAPLLLAPHREEAACGAARLAAVRAGLFSSLADSGQLLQPSSR